MTDDNDSLHSVTSNYDQEDEASGHHFTVFIPVAYSLICVFGLPGNLMVIVVFVFYEKLKTLTDTFLVNLALADFLLLCTLPFLAYEAAQSWVFGDAMCKVVRVMYRVKLYTSMLTLTSITFHRFFSVTQVTRAHRSPLHRQEWGYALCAATWVLSLLLAVPQFLYSDGHSDGCYEVYVPPHVELVVQSFQLAVGLLVPLVAMLVCYTVIIKTLISARSTQKKKSMKIIVLLVVTFIATQLPYNVMHFALILDKTLLWNPHLISAVIVLEAVAYMHACLNPVLYFFIGTKFRNSFCRIVRGFGYSKKDDDSSINIRMTDRDSRNVSASTHVEALSVYPA